MSQKTAMLMTDPEIAEGAGQRASLRCAEKVAFERPLCGEGEDFFFLSARLKRHRNLPAREKVVRFGYRELQKSLWWAHLTTSCNHRARHSGVEIELPPGYTTLQGFGNHLPEYGPRIFVCLTAGDPGARWMALATFPWVSLDEDSAFPRNVVLRKDDCCFRCALEQAALKPGPLLLIL